VTYLPRVLRAIGKVDIGRGDVGSTVVGIGSFSIGPQVLHITLIIILRHSRRCTIATDHAKHVLAVIAVICHVHELGSDAADSRSVLEVR
jgi:hypothetical protein